MNRYDRLLASKEIRQRAAPGANDDSLFIAPVSGTSLDMPAVTGLEGTGVLPTVSIVIVNMNGRRWLRGCLNSILNSSYPIGKMEIILVDNGSTDGSVELTKKILGNGHFRILVNKSNLGWSPANNQGMREANGDIIVCLSNDMEVAKDWLNCVVRLMQENANIGVVQFNSLSLWDRTTPDSGMNYLDRFGFAYGYAAEERALEVFFAEGMAFAITKKAFKEVGGFDDYYFMEYDDIDLCWRIRLLGYSVFFCPSSIVYHARGGTVGSTYFRRDLRNIVLYVRNHLVTLMKNYEMRSLCYVLPIVISVQIAKILYFAKCKHPTLALATAKGLWSVMPDMRQIVRARYQVQRRIRRVSDREIIRSMHPFSPSLLRGFLTMQANGRRMIPVTVPPDWGD